MSQVEDLRSIFYFVQEKDDVERMSSWPTAQNSLDDRAELAMRDWQEAQVILDMRKDQLLTELDRQIDELGGW